jgi:hypothetical protein
MPPAERRSISITNKQTNRNEKDEQQCNNVEKRTINRSKQKKIQKYIQHMQKNEKLIK